MSGQVLGFTGSAHQAAFELLPWFVNGTLDDGEQLQVEQHLQGCAACRRERAWLVQLAGAYSHGGDVVDTERALARIAGRLAETDMAPPSRGVAKATTARLPAWLAAPRGAWLRFAVAMQLGVIVALAWVLMIGAPHAYRTLGAERGAAQGAGTLLVVFDPATSEKDLRRILLAAGARIVDGPTEAGAYVLAVEGAADARAAALERLRGERTVTLAEPLTSERVR